MPLIQIDPDDTELKYAVGLVESKKRLYKKADALFNRAEQRRTVYITRHDIWQHAKKEYESALINLALIVMERL